jgi:lysophospholipase L1-like esterase
MKLFTCHDAPIHMFGLIKFYENGSLMRLPEEVMEKLPQLRQFGSRSTGGRMCFRTNTKNLYVKLVSKTFIRDSFIAQVGSSGLDLYIGERTKGIFLGSVFPTGLRGTNPNESEKTFTLDGEMTDITIYMPKNEILDNITIGIDDDAIIEAPTPYINKKPVVFYGSSITEGGCASRVGNAYNAALSRQLNMDYINFGFSGSAKGEPEMAEFIASVPMSIFVMDYDYNAPDAEHLQNTHEPFFRIIREKHPDLPIVMLSNPNYRLNPEENEKRLAVIRKTYENAKARGDKNVYLISGEKFYGDEDIYACTVDKIHPNDHGFALMTSEIRKTLEPILLSVIENEKEQQK